MTGERQGAFLVEAEVDTGRWQPVARGVPRREAERIVRELGQRRLHPLKARVAKDGEGGR